MVGLKVVICLCEIVRYLMSKPIILREEFDIL